MASDFRQVFKLSTIASVGNLLGKVAAFLMIPIYTTHLTPAEYGIAALLDLTSMVVGLFLGLGLTASTLRFYYEYPAESDRRDVVSTALLSSASIILLTVLLLSAFSPQLSLIVFKTSEYHAYLTLSLWNLFFSATIEVPIALLRAQQRMVFFTVITFARLVCSLALNIILIVYLDWKVWGLLYSTFFTSAAVGAIVTITTLRQVGLRLSVPKLKAMLAYGLPIVPETLGMFVLHSSDQFFLQQYGTLASVGTYALAYKFGMALHLMLFSPFWMVWGAKRFQIARQPDAPTSYARVLTYFAHGELFAGLAVALLIDDVFRVIAPPEYHAAAHLVPLIVLSYVFFGAYYLLQTGISLEKKTAYLGLILTLTAILHLLLNFLLIPRLLAAGAALSTLISFVIMSAATYHISQRLLRVPYELGRVVHLLALAVCAYAVGYFVGSMAAPFSIVLKLAAIGSFPIALFLTGFYREEELRALQGILHGLRTRVRPLEAR